MFDSSFAVVLLYFTLYCMCLLYLLAKYFLFMHHLHTNFLLGSINVFNCFGGSLKPSQMYIGPVVLQSQKYIT